MDYEEDVSWDCEEVGFEGAEAKSFEVEGEVGCWWGVGDCPAQADEVDWPHVVVAETLPEHA